MNLTYTCVELRCSFFLDLPRAMGKSLLQIAVLVEMVIQEFGEVLPGRIVLGIQFDDYLQLSPGPLELLKVVQIGRASCRERV